MTTLTEKPGIERWIEAAAKAAYEQYNRSVIGCCEPSWDDLEAAHRQRMTDAQQEAVRAFLQAAQDDGVKLTPRAMTSAMTDAYRGTAIDPEAEWEPVFDAAPDYLEETPPFGETR
jgi:hypothetical protein